MDIDEGTVLASEDDSESWQDEKGKFYFFLDGASTSISLFSSIRLSVCLSAHALCTLFQEPYIIWL